MTRVKLADLPIKWLRGNGFRKTDLVQNGEYGCILYGELFTKHKSPLIQSSKLSRTNRIGNVSTIAGDILIPGTSTAKKSDMVLGREVDSDGVFLGGDINVLRPQQGLFASRFLPYFLESQDALEQLEPYIQGATGIIHLSNKGIKSLEVPLPPLSEQQRIVSILDEAFAAIDQAKANTERNLKNAKELFDSCLNANVEILRGTYPSVRLDSMLERITYGFTNPMPSSDFGPWMLTAKNIQNGFIDYETGRRTTKEAYDELLTDKSRGRIGDVLLTKDGTLGRVAVLDRENCCLNQSVAILRPSKRLLPEFLMFILISNQYQKLMLSQAGGSTIKHLYITRVDKLLVPEPPISDQFDFIEKTKALLSATFDLDKTYRKKLTEITLLKKSIVSNAFNGKLDSQL